jgi:hypothetical protein
MQTDQARGAGVKHDTSLKAIGAAETVWRYMTFSRFLWLLQKKQLWLSRADLLGDPWEIPLTGDQLEHVLSHHPPTDIFSREPREPAKERAARIIKLWRRGTYVNCWSSGEDESHALWRIYCRSSEPEGVALQTTLPKLRESAAGLPLLRVTYEGLGRNRRTPTVEDLVTKKRPMFAYEREVRIVRAFDAKDEVDEVMPEEGDVGFRLQWDPEHHIESIRVHPEPDHSFFETVSAVVEHYAPALKDRVEWSAMKAGPPF